MVNSPSRCSADQEYNLWKDSTITKIFCQGKKTRKFKQIRSRPIHQTQFVTAANIETKFHSSFPLFNDGLSLLKSLFPGVLTPAITDSFFAPIWNLTL